MRRPGASLPRALPGPRRRPLGASADPAVRRSTPTSARCCPTCRTRSLQEHLERGQRSGARRAERRASIAGSRERYAQHGGRPLGESRVLDFGCGWGRLTRLLARDVEPGRLFGCDPVEAILDQCRRDRGAGHAGPDRVRSGAAALRRELRSRLSPSRCSPTCPKPRTRAACAPCTARSTPGGLLVLTVRPPQYLAFAEPDAAGARAARRGPRGPPRRGALHVRRRTPPTERSSSTTAAR